MSDEMRWYVGGQQKLMPELLAMVACTVNSYSRLIPGFWAPTTATWGVENRTTRVARDSRRRVEPARRIPHRRGRHQSVPGAGRGASAPGLYGIENKIEPDPMVEGNAYDKKFPKTRSLPRTLTEASEWLEKSKAGRALFGDAFVEHFAASREWEDREFRRAITDWELARYFEIIMNSQRHPEDHQPGRRAGVRRASARDLGEINEIAAHRASRLQPSGATCSLAERAAILTRFCDEFEKRGAQIAEELTWQMGRPARYAPNEVRGTLERARHMIAIAPQALGDLDAGPKDNFRRFVRREPLGVVFTVAAWNYPFLIAVNSVVPALMAGNVVVLKHSAQTPLAAERFAECLDRRGSAQGRVPGAACLARGHGPHHPRSARRLRRVHGLGRRRPRRAARGGARASSAWASSSAAAIRCTCATTPTWRTPSRTSSTARISIPGSPAADCSASTCITALYQKFTEGFVELTRKYSLGDPTDAATTLGPLVRTAAADGVRAQIQASIAAGATGAIRRRLVRDAAQRGTPYLAPQVLLDVDHRMPVMREEIFGPVAGIMKVSSDDEAVDLMNDSDFGLTAAIWTEDADAALALGPAREHRHLVHEPLRLPRSRAGVGGREGFGRAAVRCRWSATNISTRPKSFHMRLKTS